MPVDGATHRWLQLTFRNKKVTEDLLKPHLENGTISWRDYAAALQSLPTSRWQLFSPIFWLLAGGSISYIVSRRGFKSTRSTAVLAAVFTSTASFDIPVIVRHRTVNSFWDHLENKENFEDALEFIRKAHPVPFMRDFPSFKKSGSTPDQPKEARSQSPWVDRESNDEKAGAALSSQDASEASRPIGQEEAVVSRWEQIRRASTTRNQEANPNQLSAWEQLRQRGPVEYSSNDRRPLPSREVDATRQRAIAQAEFDKMLEEERQRSAS